MRQWAVGPPPISPLVVADGGLHQGSRLLFRFCLDRKWVFIIALFRVSVLLCPSQYFGEVLRLFLNQREDEGILLQLSL